MTFRSTSKPSPGTGNRVGIYARFSSENQRDASIDDQLRVCHARAQREGWHIAETFTDYALSGSTTLRPRYQALLTAIRLALQLRIPQISESMGNHDSEIMEWRVHRLRRRWSFGRPHCGR